MEREFGALKGLMGVNGLTGGDVMPEIGLGLSAVTIDSCVDAVKGCAKGCETSCQPGCTSCKSGRQNG